MVCNLILYSARHGDTLRTGWKQLLQIVMHIFQLDLLPPDVLILEVDEQAKDRLPRPFARQLQASGSSLWTRALSRHETSTYLAQFLRAAMISTLLVHGHEMLAS